MKRTMKTYKIYIAIFSIALLMTSCFKDMEIVFNDTQVEFEQAVMTARATGQIFPILNVTRASGTPNYQVNLIGAHLSQGEPMSVTLDQVPADLLNANTIVAEEGVHFTLTNNFNFPADASKVNFTGLTVINDFPAQTGKTALLILRLDGNEKIKPAENFRRLGIRINLN